MVDQVDVESSVLAVWPCPEKDLTDQITCNRTRVLVIGPDYLSSDQITCHRTRVRSLPCNSLTALTEKIEWFEKLDCVVAVADVGVEESINVMLVTRYWDPIRPSYQVTILISQSRIIYFSKTPLEMELACTSYELLVHSLHCLNHSNRFRSSHCLPWLYCSFYCFWAKSRVTGVDGWYPLDCCDF